LCWVFLPQYETKRLAGQKVTESRAHGPRGLSLGLTLSGLGLDLGFMASGLGLIEIGLVAGIFTVHMTLIDIHKIAIDNHLCCVLVAY